MLRGLIRLRSRRLRSHQAVQLAHLFVEFVQLLYNRSQIGSGRGHS
jgi:hypothetical protein